MDDTRQLFTIGQLADQLQESPARVGYVIAKYRLRPVSRVGIIRLFDAKQAEAVKLGIFDLQARKS